MSTCKRASIILLDIPAHRSHKLKYSADLSAPNANSLITAFAHHANGDEASKAHYQMADRESFQMMCVALHISLASETAKQLAILRSSSDNPSAMTIALTRDRKKRQ